MEIPVSNIYYILCYAWDKLEEADKAGVSASDYEDAINLFARVLVNGSRQLFKRGLEHSYRDVSEEYIGIKGKLNFKESLNRNLFKQGRSVCEFSQFDNNNLQNQLLKATLATLLRTDGLEKDLRLEIRDCCWRFPGVSDIDPAIHLFSQIRIHRNNSFYDFLLHICKLILENIVLDERTGRYQFKEFVREEKAMARLFEEFVRNFYKKEQSVFSVRREDIDWFVTPLGESTRQFLPKMQTDLTLESKTRKIIVETKYYKEALSTRFETEKFKSHNLYQLYSYLRNIENSESHGMNPGCEGILLYPTVNYRLDERYDMLGHNVKVCTVDLSKDWRSIELELLSLLN